jgi:hypothetical protein
MKIARSISKAGCRKKLRNLSEACLAVNRISANLSSLCEIARSQKLDVKVAIQLYDIPEKWANV